MINVTIDADEAYPVYFMHLSDDDFWKTTGQIDTETYDRWVRVAEEYRQIQSEMASFLCIKVSGVHSFITLSPGQGSRTYCTKCFVDKGETQWT